jgi:putative endonuclease
VQALKMPNVVFILHSESTGKYYIGQTENLEGRIIRYNRGDTRSTKAGCPSRIVYVEQHSTRDEAVLRERF